MKRILALFYARNLEFVRDRAALGWNLAFPVLLLMGFAFAFTSDSKPQYKFGVIGDSAQTLSTTLDLKYVSFVSYDSSDKAMNKLTHHQLDLLIDPTTNKYWINTDSPTGYFAEKVLLATVGASEFTKEAIRGKAIRYVDWVLPGILGMNMMFSALFGVGYVIVRYRKNGVLKRLKATPLSAVEFLLAQVFSRIFIMIMVSSFVYLGCDLIVNFYMAGSYFDLLVVAILGGMSIISLGLLMASRTKSEEFAGGLLNMISWPMMFLSGVWFSLEGTPNWVQQLAQVFPLTHLVEGARLIMLEGATLTDIWGHLLSLIVTIIFCLGLGSLLFNWGE